MSDWFKLQECYYGHRSRMETLRPCPFCGSRQDMGGPDYATGRAVVRVHGADGRLHIECRDCGARSSDYPKTEAETIERWNRRYKESPDAAR